MDQPLGVIKTVIRVIVTNLIECSDDSFEIHMDVEALDCFGDVFELGIYDHAKSLDLAWGKIQLLRPGSIHYVEGNFSYDKDSCDLMQPFKIRDIYLWEAKGSYSIKPILPLLAPELSYKHLVGVANGGDAMDAYYTMNSTEDAEELAMIRKQLLEYCKLDTEAMVRILERLREMVQ